MPLVVPGLTSNSGQPEYSPVVAMFGVTNEPVGSTIGFQNLAS